jgi:hypothetical protein
MDIALRKKVEDFVHENIGTFHQARINNLRDLKLKKLIENKNPYLFRARNLNSAADFVAALLEARLSSSEEGSFGSFLEDLAIYVATETCGGQKAPAHGIDIDLTKDGTRYLISVKSGKSWGNSSQHKALRQDFQEAVRIIRQSKYAGRIQPTLGICYGRFRTRDNGLYLHIGGQSFWHLLSDDPNLYTDIIGPLGHEAEQHDEVFKQEKNNAFNRMTREFTIEFCDEAGAIQWPRLVQFVSQNLTS